MGKPTNKILGHGADADGIEEYDNPLPDWWIGMFVVSTIIGIAYGVNYHFISNRSQARGYEEQMAAAEKQWPLKMRADIKTDAATIASGKEVFEQNCVGCHAPDLTGGIGPNLVDSEWIHGGKPAEVIKTITEGVPAKQMPSWGPILGPKKVQQVASFIFSKKGKGSEASKKPKVAADDASLSGEQIFAKNCVACHKADLSGGIGPNLVDDEWIHGGELANITKTITDGVPDKGMTTWGPILGKKNVAKVAKYVYGKSHADAAPAGLSGAEIFASKCAACHNTDLTGAVGPNLIDAEWIHGGDLASVTKTITEGVPSKGMISWGPLLSAKEIDTVAKFVLSKGKK